MRRRLWGAAVLLGLFAGVAPVAAVEAVAAPHGGGPVPLERLFDNTAVSDDERPGAADFDGSGSSLSAQDLTAAGWTPGRTLTVQGARLTWPRRAAGEPDNVRADAQSVRLRGRGDALAFLVTGTAGSDVSGTGTVRYANGTRSSYRLTSSDWRTGPLATRR